MLVWKKFQATLVIIVYRFQLEKQIDIDSHNWIITPNFREKNSRIML